MGPVTGRIMAAILAGDPPEIDVALADPERFNRRSG
jgi:glycine/D-amino acid oxidase-like deaminating enzyme